MIDFDVIAWGMILFPIWGLWIVTMIGNLGKSIICGIKGQGWQRPLMEFSGQLGLTLATIIIGFWFLTR